MTDVIAGMEGIALIPIHYRDGMLRYIEQHIRPGHFLSAVLSGDLANAIRYARYANDINCERLDDYLMFLDTYAPHNCYGSPETFEAWTKDQNQIEAVELFSKELWLDHVDSKIEDIAGKPFLKFIVTRRAPVYTHALQRVQTALSEDNAFKGRIDVELTDKPTLFPESIEASILEGMISRTSRAISEGESSVHGIGFVPFHNREEIKVIQPATHLILGRRGVGKSTLIGKAVEVLRKRKNLCVVIDFQAYAHRDDLTIIDDLFVDILDQLDKELATRDTKTENIRQKIAALSRQIKDGKLKGTQAAILELKRVIKEATSAFATDFFLFLDDFHLISQNIQPKVIAALHGSLKGARGWLKIAGLTTLVKYYDQANRTGLQVPGDAQIIPLDLTLTDPQAAETHLRSILSNYLVQVGVKNVSAVIGEAPFRRLVWANAGVVRDFLQMFSIALVSARRAKRSRVALSDVNISIGELGKQKMSDLEQDGSPRSPVGGHDYAKNLVIARLQWR